MLAVHDGLLIGGMGPKRWARLGCVLACVAILLNQTLLPALHFASGSLWPSSAAGVSQAIHSHAIALAHVTLEAEEAAAGSFYKAVLRVGHG
jgi:uncharacterized protein YcnI